MPQFRARPVLVDAIQYRGNVGELPKPWAEILVQLSGGLVKVETPEGARDLRLSDWLVREPDGGVRVVSAALMERLYDAISDGGPHAPAVGEMAVTWLGAAGDPDMRSLDWLGHRFLVGEPVGVSDQDALRRLAEHPHFLVEPLFTSPTPEPVLEQPRKRGRPPSAAPGPALVETVVVEPPAVVDDAFPLVASL